MKHIAQVFSYLRRNFWLPVAVMLIPSVVACFLSTPYWEVSFVAAFDYDPRIGAGRTFAILFGDSWQYIWPVIVISALQIVGAALIMSAIDVHFRTGKLSLKRPWRLVNNSVFPMAIGILVICAISILWRFVLFGLVSLTQAIADGAHFPTGLTMAIISIISLGLFIVHILMITPVLYWAPIMFIYGYRFRDAAALSYKLISGQKLFMGIMLPLLLCAGVQLLLAYLIVPVAISKLVSALVYLFTNVYVTVYVILTFYSISGLERRDIKIYDRIQTSDGEDGNGV